MDDSQYRELTPVKAPEPSTLMRLACSAPSFLQIQGPSFGAWEDACEYLGFPRDTSIGGVSGMRVLAAMDAKWRFMWAEAMQAAEAQHNAERAACPL